MTLIQYLLINIPIIVLGLLIVGGAVFLSIIGLLIVRRLISHHTLKLHNDVASAIFQTLGTIFAVLLAFTVIITWQDFDRSNNNAVREANCLADVYRDSIALDKSFRKVELKGLDDYIKGIINEEWPMLAYGQRSMRVQNISTKLWKIMASYKPKTETEKIFFKESVQKLNEAGELRRQRILDSRTGLNPVFWMVLILGGMITVMFCWFFGSENFGAQMLMTSMLAALIALVLFTIMVLDYPFSGSVSITPDAFNEILKYLSAAHIC